MSHWFLLVSLVDIGLASAVTVHAVLWKRDSRSVIGWVGLAWLAPFVGSAAYYFLGINRVSRKHVSVQLRKLWRESQCLHSGPGSDIPSDVLDETDSIFAYLAVLGKTHTGREIVAGNEVTVLVNGDESYPAMLEAIERAEQSVSLLSFIFDSDRAGDAFAKALRSAQQRGVEVRVLIDDVGSRYSRPNMVDRLEAEGIAVRGFLPTRLARWLKYANLRNHRKILVVDGRVGFTGGTNIREGHWLELQPASKATCLHFRLEGPIVSHLQEAFAIDWAFASQESLAGPTWFPVLSAKGDVCARGIAHGPDEDFEIMTDILFGALASARRKVRIVTPYFLPESSLIKALTVAAMRGVDLRVYLPEKNNIALVQWASTAQLWQILERGCRVFLTPPPFDHTKLMTVDDSWSLIGSTNWDPRSLRLNFEFNVECYSQSLAASLNSIVDEKERTAREITLADVDARAFPIRLRDGLARLFSPYL